MHDRRDLVGAQRGGEPGSIVQIALDERAPAHRLCMPARQIVIDDRPIAGGGQSLAGMAADIAGAAGDEDRFRHMQEIGLLLRKRGDNGAWCLSLPPANGKHRAPARQGVGSGAAWGATWGTNASNARVST